MAESKPSNPSDFIFDPPKIGPVTGLYNPTMVTILVRGEKFTIPRSLICEKSQYFKSIFLGGFVESERRETKLEDVRPRVFKVFVGWLYYGRVFIDRSEEEKNMETGEKRTFDEAFSATASSSFVEQAASTSPESEKTDERYDDTDPVTWSWRTLFELYLFSDQYDTRRLRMQLMNIIQLKHLQVSPVANEPPSIESTIFAVTKLPSTSPLRRFLVASWTKCHTGPKEAQSKYFGQMPQDFLVECLVSQKAHCAAMALCLTQGMCEEDGSHEESDHAGLQEDDPCLYHEHPEGQSEEKDQCSDLWRKLLENFCEPRTAFDAWKNDGKDD